MIESVGNTFLDAQPPPLSPFSFTLTPLDRVVERWGILTLSDQAPTASAPCNGPCWVHWGPPARQMPLPHFWSSGSAAQWVGHPSLLTYFILVTCKSHIPLTLLTPQNPSSALFAGIFVVQPLNTEILQGSVFCMTTPTSVILFGYFQYYVYNIILLLLGYCIWCSFPSYISYHPLPAHWSSLPLCADCPSACSLVPLEKHMARSFSLLPRLKHHVLQGPGHPVPSSIPIRPYTFAPLLFSAQHLPLPGSDLFINPPPPQNVSSQRKGFFSVLLDATAPRLRKVPRGR